MELVTQIRVTSGKVNASEKGKEQDMGNDGKNTNDHPRGRMEEWLRMSQYAISLEPSGVTQETEPCARELTDTYRSRRVDCREYFPPIPREY